METLQIFLKTEEQEEGAENVSIHHTQILPEETTCKEPVKSERYVIFFPYLTELSTYFSNEEVEITSLFIGSFYIHIHIIIIVWPSWQFTQKWCPHSITRPGLGTLNHILDLRR
jgi:hypothetical protein